MNDVILKPNTKPSRKWLSTEVQLLKKCFSEGKSSAEIARRLHRTTGSVRSKKNEMGLFYMARWTESEDRQLRALVAEGKKVAEIASILTTRTERAIHCRKEALKLYNVHKLSPRDLRHVAGVIKFRMAGWKLKDIAKVYGVDFTNVSYVLRQNGFKGFWWVRTKHKTPRQYWSEVEIHLLRKHLKKGMSIPQIVRLRFPYRSLASVRKKAIDITRYWLSEAELAERQSIRKKQLRVY